MPDDEPDAPDEPGDSQERGEPGDGAAAGARRSRRPVLIAVAVLVVVLVVAAVIGAVASRSNDDDAVATASSLDGGSTSTPITSSGGSDLIDACAAGLTTTAAGTITSPEITETSGIVASPDHPDVWWVHNDSGDTARFFAVRSEGTLVATEHLPGVTATDIEDIAMGPDAGTDPGRPDVYLADMGDNNRQRSEIVIHRVPEPDPAPTAEAKASDANATGDVALRYRYPDGAHDAEALLVDPASGELVIVTKDWSLAGQSEIYRADGRATPDPSTVTTLEHVGTVSLPLATLVTGADISRDGTVVALRSYDGVRLYRRPAGQPLWTAFAAEPCKVAIPDEKQGEAVGFSPDATSFMTVSEGADPVLHRTTG